MTDLQISLFIKIFFSLISAIILILSMLTVLVNNAFISVFLFVSTYFFPTLSAIMAGAEFLNHIILFVYIGAIAVPFLFAVMNFRDTISIKPFSYSALFFYTLCSVIIVMFYSIFSQNLLFIDTSSSLEFNILLDVIFYTSENIWVFNNFSNFGTNLQVLGEFLYTIGSSSSVNAGLVLLLAMLFIIRYCRRF